MKNWYDGLSTGYQPVGKTEVIDRLEAYRSDKLTTSEAMSMFSRTLTKPTLRSFCFFMLLLAYIGFWICGVAASSTFAQFSEPLVPQVQQQEPEVAEPVGELHEFRNELGDVIVKGYFVKIKGKQIVIREPNGIEMTRELAVLSQADREWIVDEIELRRIHGIAEKKLEKIKLEYLRSVKQSKVITGLERILRLGKDAPFAEPIAEQYLSDSNPAPVRAAAFAAIVAVVPAEETNLQNSFAAMIDDQYEIESEIVAQPKNVITAISTFGEMSLPYLKTVAFSGNVIPLEGTVEPPAEPVADCNESQALARIAAVKAIATVSSSLNLAQREENLQTIMSLFPAVEQADGYDPKPTIRVCLNAIGEIGISNAAVLKKLDQFSANPSYAKQVERLRAKFQRSQAK